MNYIYGILFAVGVLYTLVSFVISGISGALHMGSHFGHANGDFGGHGHVDAAHGHGHLHTGGDTGGIDGHHAHPEVHDVGAFETVVSWFSILINPIVAVSFLTVFGGIGILGTQYFKWVAVAVFLVALAAGVVTAFLLYRFVAIPLYKSENSTHVSRDNLVGMQAEVISSILENGFGEIKYTVNSIRFTGPARHIDDKAVKQGVKVIICKIENNIFYVSEMQEL